MKILYVWLLMPILSSAAAEKAREFARQPPSQPAQGGQAAAPVRPLVYRPPKVGLPKVTAACGIRSDGDERLELSVLAPNHTGWTTQEAPVLIWRRSGPNRWPLEATLVVPGQPDPILQVKLESDGEWHRLDLAKYQVQLQAGLTYQWAIAAILDPASRSKDLVAGGEIQRINPPDDLAKSVGALSAKDCILEFAERGCWYDAIDALAVQLKQSPNDSELRQWCASLCEQGGLKPFVIGQSMSQGENVTAVGK